MQLFVPPCLFEQAKVMFPDWEVIKQEWIDDKDWYLITKEA
jgi:hypothetical protein